MRAGGHDRPRLADGSRCASGRRDRAASLVFRNCAGNWLSRSCKSDEASAFSVQTAGRRQRGVRASSAVLPFRVPRACGSADGDASSVTPARHWLCAELARDVCCRFAVLASQNRRNRLGPALAASLCDSPCAFGANQWRAIAAVFADISPANPSKSDRKPAW